MGKTLLLCVSAAVSLRVAATILLNWFEVSDYRRHQDLANFREVANVAMLFVMQCLFTD